MFEFEPVTIQRKTRESQIQTTIKGDELDPNLKANINTTIHFLNHMIEQWAWRSCLNLGVEVTLSDFVLQHVIAEDSGQCFGMALAKVVEKLMKEQGINANGYADGFIDEAAARARISFEFRSSLHFHHGSVHVPERVEDMLCTDLFNFLDGLSQGARCTIHIDLIHGFEPHHIWESVFRALGEATRMALSPCPWRKAQGVGVAGFIDITEK